MICELLKYFQGWFSKWFHMEITQDSLSMMNNVENVENENSTDENTVKIESSSPKPLSKKGKKLPNGLRKPKKNS